MTATKNGDDLVAKKTSLAAGVGGAVMAVLICFGAAFAFSNLVEPNVGQQLHKASAQAND